MKAFRYVALAPDGRRLASLGYAPDAATLRDQLIEGRLHPLSIRPALLQGQNRLSLNEAEAARLGRDLSQLTASGVSVVQALSLLQSRETPRVAAVAREMRTRLTAGEPLSEAFKATAGRPGRFLQALARAGEASGKQSEVLAAGAESLKVADQLRKRLLTLTLYPAFVILVALGAIAVYAYAVLPSLEPAFEGLGDDLPTQTRLVLTFGAVIRAVLPILCLAAGAIILAAILIPRFRYWMTDAFSALATSRKRSSLRDFVYANLASRLAVMLRAGVPLSAAWRLACEPISIRTIRNRLTGQDDRLMEGARLSDAFKAVAGVPTDLIHYVALGEQAGATPKALADAAEALGARAQESIERALSIMTPLVIVLVGGMVGLITMMVFQGLLAIGDAVG